MDAEVFEDFDYVALGHLHGPQNIGSNRIRYCGTPLKYSFSECGHHKSVTVVELGAKGDLTLRLCPLVPRHDMRQIRGTFAELTDKANYGGTATEDYLQIVLTDDTVSVRRKSLAYLAGRYPSRTSVSHCLRLP